MKYRSRPKIIEATQWFPGVNHLGVFEAPHSTGYYVVTIHGQKTYIVPGDWIVQEPDGVHYYPIKNDIFIKGFDPL